MFLTEENEKKAYDAMQKMQALDAAGKWDELTEEALFWSLIHCVYEHMNSDQILKRPTVKLPWSPDEWKAEVRAKSIKALNMFLGYMPPEVRERFSQSKTVSADHVFNYLRETWESRDYYSDWHRRWKWRWDYGNPMPTYEERVEYVYAMMELLEKRKKKEQRRLAKKKAEEVRETKAKVKGKGEGKAKGKGKVPEPKRSNISSALPGPPPPPSAMSQPLEVAVANERPMEVSPSPQDPLTAPPVMVAEKMLSELQL